MLLSLATLMLLFATYSSISKIMWVSFYTNQQKRDSTPLGDKGAAAPSIVNLELSDGEQLSMLNYEPIGTFNDMKVSYNKCEPSFHDDQAEIGKKDSSARLVVITNFFYVDPAKHNLQSLEIGDGRQVDNKTARWRNMEIINTLASNLKHSHIEEIHILVDSDEAADYLRRMPLENSQRMVIQIMGRTVEMKMQLEYAGRCLQNRIVAVSHQDNLFGEGWENITSSVLISRRLMYALTRHSSHGPCKASKLFTCDAGSTYVGSHDVFVFHVKEKFTREMLKPLDNATPNLNGMENVLIWMFEKNFNYTVLNPCPVLIVHHQHCIAIRGKGRKRINTRETTGRAAFTNKLE